MIRYATIIQARMGSTRRPGKINYMFQGEPMLGYQIKRLQQGGIKDIIVATTTHQRDDITESLAKKVGVPCFRGSENDVLERYIECTRAFNVENIIRVGGDDPLIDPACIEALIKAHEEIPVDFIFASHAKGWIYGTAGELISLKALEKSAKETQNLTDKEHVVSFLKRSDHFTKRTISPNNPLLCRQDIFVSVDYQEDLDLIEQILAYFSQLCQRYTFSQEALIKLFDSGRLNISNKHLHKGFD